MRTNKAAESIIYVAVVDDDESVCRSFGRLLRIAGFQPVTYSSAEAFLADTKRPQFDCLVLDVQLEGISGAGAAPETLCLKDCTPSFSSPRMTIPPSSRGGASGCAGYFRKTDPGALVPRSHQPSPSIHPIVIARTQAPNQPGCGPTKTVRKNFSSHASMSINQAAGLGLRTHRHHRRPADEQQNELKDAIMATDTKEKAEDQRDNVQKTRN